jgi:hypothetical protein
MTTVAALTHIVLVYVYVYVYVYMRAGDARRVRDERVHVLPACAAAVRSGALHVCTH